jgi:hypothetical protein
LISNSAADGSNLDSVAKELRADWKALYTVWPLLMSASVVIELISKKIER